MKIAAAGMGRAHFIRQFNVQRQRFGFGRTKLLPPQRFRPVPFAQAVIGRMPQNESQMAQALHQRNEFNLILTGQCREFRDFRQGESIAGDNGRMALIGEPIVIFDQNRIQFELAGSAD